MHIGRLAPRWMGLWNLAAVRGHSCTAQPCWQRLVIPCERLTAAEGGRGWAMHPLVSGYEALGLVHIYVGLRGHGSPFKWMPAFPTEKKVHAAFWKRSDRETAWCFCSMQFLCGFRKRTAFLNAVPRNAFLNSRNIFCVYALVTYDILQQQKTIWKTDVF